MGTRRRGRPETRLNPEAGPIQAFASGLRALRESTGLTYQQLAKRTFYEAHTLSRAADGKRLPSRELTRAFVQACSGDSDEWEARRQQALRQLDADGCKIELPSTPGDDDPPPTALPPPRNRPPGPPGLDAIGPPGETDTTIHHFGAGHRPSAPRTARLQTVPAARSHAIRDYPVPLELITSPKQLAAALNTLRFRSGLTLRDISRIVGVPSSTIGGYFAGTHLPTPRIFEAVFPQLLRVLGAMDSELEDWRAAFWRARDLGRQPVSGEAPYRGLAAFQTNDAAWFFGREELVSLLVQRAQERRALGRPLIVVGPSGAGKSSVLRAGLLPRLEQSGPATLLTPVSVDRTAPAALAHALTSLPAARWVIVDQFEELFTHDVAPDQRTAFINGLLAAARGDRADDIAGADADGPVGVVIGLRADFYAHAAASPQLAETLQNGQVVVGSMTGEQLRKAILGPARRAGLGVESGLVELLLRDLAPTGTAHPDAGHDSGALPLLSHALLATWQQSRGRTLTIEHYLAAGGIHGSVARTAEAAYLDLADVDRPVARRLFTRLVLVQDGLVDTRRRVPLAELSAARKDIQGQRVIAVANRFIEARLLTADGDMIQITHETLLTAWPRLRAWLDGDREWLRLLRRLADAAAVWADSGRDADTLLRGATLQITLDAVEQGERRVELNELESEYLEASAARQAAQARRTRTGARRRTQIAVLLAVLLAVAVSSLIYARQVGDISTRDQQQALSRQVAAQSDRQRGQDVSLSMQLALAAYRISPTPEALSSLLDSTATTAETQATVGAQTITATGTLIAACTTTGTVQLYTAARHGKINPVGTPLSGGCGAKGAIALSHGGLLAVLGTDDRVHLWDVSDPAHPRALVTLSGTQPTAMALALSPDGRTLAVAVQGHLVQLWDTHDPGHARLVATLTGPTAPVRAMVFGPDSGLLAVGSEDATIRLWSVSKLEHPTPVGVVTAQGRVLSVAISPDGRTLAAGTTGGNYVYQWDLTTPAHPRTKSTALAGPASWVNSVVFSPDGRSLAAGSSDGKLWLFNLETGQVDAKLPQPGPVTAVQYLSDGTPVTDAIDGTIRWWQLPGPLISGFGDATVFAMSFDADGRQLGIAPDTRNNTVTLWNVSDAHHPTRTGPPIYSGMSMNDAYYGSGALSPDGRVFYAGDIDGTIQVWNLGDPKRPAAVGTPLPATSGLVEALTVNGAGDLLAVSDDDGTVHLYNTADPLHPLPLASIRTPGAGVVYQAAFDPTGHTLAVASSDHDLYLYNISDPKTPVLLATVTGFTDSAMTVAFSHDGSTLAVGSMDGSIRLWDVTHPNLPERLGLPLFGPAGSINSLAFSAQDILVAGGSASSSIWLWDTRDPARPTLLATLTGQASGVYSVAFSPDGKTLATGGNGSVQLWNTDTSSAAHWICSIAGQPLSLTEWAKYVPDSPYNPPCT